MPWSVQVMIMTYSEWNAEGTLVFWTSVGWYNLTRAQQGQFGLNIETKLKEGKLSIREPAWQLMQ